jgi:thiol-disulfide isomerase/thioredoxin
MNPSALRGGGAVMVAVVAIWAGVRVHTLWSAASSRADRAGMAPVSVGETPRSRPPTAADLPDLEAIPPNGGKVPDVLPEFSLAGRSGAPTSIRNWSGRSLIINFWATWCAPCRKEIPLLQSLGRDWASRNVTVLGIAVDYREKVLAYAAELNITYPLLIGEQDALDVAAQFGVESPVFPFTVFTDRRGEVVALYVGELHKAQADLILSVVHDLDLGKLALPMARRTITDGLHALGEAAHG